MGNQARGIRTKVPTFWWTIQVAILVFCIPLGSTLAAEESDPQEIAPWDSSPLASSLPPPEARFDPECTSGTESASCGDALEPFRAGDLFLRTDAGVSYFNVPHASKFGVFEGLSLGGQLSESSYLIGDINFNQVSGDTQLSGVLSWVVLPKFWEPGGWNRFGYSLFAGSYTDTWLDDGFISQARLDLNYALSAQWSLGVHYNTPLGHAQQDRAGRTPSLLETVRASERIGGHLQSRIGPVGLWTEATYRESSKSMVLSALGSAAFNERYSLFASVSYQDQGVWISGVGVQCVLGPRRRIRRDQYRGHELPNEFIKITNTYREVPAVLIIESFAHEVFEEGLVTSHR